MLTKKAADAGNAQQKVAPKAAAVKKAIPAEKPKKKEPIKKEQPADVPAPKAKKDSGAAKEKPVKIKLVRDSFTMPDKEYAVLGEVKKECLKAGIAVKKSELLRVGVALVRKLDLNALKEQVAALPVLKAGRPKKSK